MNNQTIIIAPVPRRYLPPLKVIIEDSFSKEEILKDNWWKKSKSSDNKENTHTSASKIAASPSSILPHIHQPNSTFILIPTTTRSESNIIIKF